MTDETTEYPVKLEDHARANALLICYAIEDTQGMAELLAQAQERKRGSALIVALLDMHKEIVPELLTPAGIGVLSQEISRMANATEPEHALCATTAQVIEAHSMLDSDRFNHLIRQVHDGAELIITIMRIFANYVGVLYGTVGVEILRRNALNWAAQEQDQ